MSDIFDVNFNNRNIEIFSDEAKALYLYDAFCAGTESLLFVVKNYNKALYYFHILSALNENVLFYPCSDYFIFNENVEYSSLRYSVLNKLNNRKKTIVICTLTSFLIKVAGNEEIVDNVIHIAKNEEVSITKLSEKLIDSDYSKEIYLTAPGEFSVRGFVFDIFPYAGNNPIRLEFFGDEIIDIRKFDLNTQESFEKISDLNLLLLPSNTSKSNTISDYVSIVYFDDYDYLYGTYKEEMSFLDNNAKYNNFSLFEDSISYKNSYNFVGINNIIADRRIMIEKIIKLKKLRNTLELVENYNSLYLILCFTSDLNMKNFYDKNKQTSELYSCGFNNSKINLMYFPIKEGFKFGDYCFLSENEFLSVSSFGLKKEKIKKKNIIDSHLNLKIGDYVVHYVHGIGKYLGLKIVFRKEIKKEYIEIEYKNSDKLFVPVDKIDFLSKYSGDTSIKPRVSNLGNNDFENVKNKVKSYIKELSIDLLKLYSERDDLIGFGFNDYEEELSFADDFIYTLTDDQVKVIEEIFSDMSKEKPMDRLLCGDVGFGKTEVAFRAIFKAIMNGKQTLMLCPTTILSNQHFLNALKRFENFPVNIKVFNRLISTSEADSVLKGAKNGRIDLVIGTHRALSDKLKFKNLGLFVVDEEQRFGVGHKEKLKNASKNVDVLTLTATPIPRTLQMSLTGIRDLSLIETPPVDRLPIQTYIVPESNKLIKQAIVNEVARNGQTFILYNDVARGRKRVEFYKKEFPNLVIEHVHGKMNKERIESIMEMFSINKIHVLVCTTIIETGIDIPNANTLIVLDSEMFGLSQLYQIRGRVGRSDRLAYCYLMYQQGRVLTTAAYKRLTSIRDFSELGSGIKIASRDLAIRGAGTIFGASQAGFVADVGYDLFMEMLNDETRRLKGEVVVERKEDALPSLNINTAIPDTYNLEDNMKIELHKIINDIKNKDDIKKVYKYIEDNYGFVDESLEIYMYHELFEKLLSNVSVKKVCDLNNFVEITFSKKAFVGVDGKDLFFAITELGSMFRFKNLNNLIIIYLDKYNLNKHYIYYLIDLFEILNELIEKTRIIK